MSSEGADADAVAAIDAAQQQLHAAGRSTLEEHLRHVAQCRVDDELATLRESGAWKDSGSSYVVTVRRDDAIFETRSDGSTPR